MIRALALAAAILGGLVITGCTTTQHQAKLENPADIREAAGGEAFPGILKGSGKATPAVRYIFHTHGMGMTDVKSVLIQPVTLALQQAGYSLETTPAESRWIDAPTAKVHEFEGEALSCEGGAALQPPCLYDHFGQYRIDRFIHADGVSRVVVYSYLWHDDLWRLQRPFLEHDLAGLQTGFAGWTAGSLTRGLKTSIVNEGLSDVAAYLGPAGGALKEGMSSAVCIMLREAAGRSVTTAQHNSAISLSPSDCLDKNGAQSLLERNVRISFISHSLGSRMLFDVLSAPASGKKKQEADLNPGTPTMALVATRKVTDTFFMAANQLPLLGIAEVKGPQATSPGVTGTAPPAAREAQAPGCPKSLPGFLTADCRAPKDSGTRKAQKSGMSMSAQNAMDEIRPLKVVGFFDPGDILGYSLMGGRTGQGPKDISFISVLHRNTPQILRLGSNPLDAHDNELAPQTLARPGVGYPRAHQAPPYPRDRPTEVFKSPNAMAMIFCGANSDSQGRLTPGKCLPR
jgi:hypothetical protein